MTDSTSDRLYGTSLEVAYDDRTVINGVDITIPDGSFTVIVGPNACGKSTLLRALARLLPVSNGSVVLDGRAIHEYRSRDVARRLGLLPQSSTAPEGITVVDLVSRGRFPHQSLMSRWSREDERVVAEAMDATGVTDLRNRPLDELSGGQRQRVWVAMALAQQTPILLLDEPTTFLDIAHQIELLDLIAHLRAEGRTVVAVLHEINLAARYATHLIAMRDGRIVAEGAPGEVVTEELVEQVFGLSCRVIPDPDTGGPVVLPRGRAVAQLEQDFGM
ncbi:ABC transporter ATP-binding protein [Microbacterium invictum]|uniref:Iron complex transport system ATP-binding protein n=1 Tax=Microbacterium invictum TaxID=515415 RepID=A0AA40SNF1_9MICO|nr:MULTISPECIES: ABC transporter ATP-binding protein [Microbacterium]MBB4139432.1 iron complex transport system ATP-binding protein [Microbacterium invictum]